MPQFDVRVRVRKSFSKADQINCKHQRATQAIGIPTHTSMITHAYHPDTRKAQLERASQRDIFALLKSHPRSCLRSLLLLTMLSKAGNSPSCFELVPTFCVSVFTMIYYLKRKPRSEVRAGYVFSASGRPPRRPAEIRIQVSRA